jgi:DNA-binding response OmpR family regulator
LLALDDYPLPTGDGLVVVYSPEFDMQDWLCCTCRRGGYSTVWLRPHQSIRVEGARAAIFDATECLGDELAELHRLATIMGPAPIIALLNFPRVEDRDRALAAGAATVLSKPVLIEDLLWQIKRRAPPSARSDPTAMRSF